MRLRLRAVLVVLALVSAPARARAEECSSGRPTIALQTSALDAKNAAAVASHLRASLHGRGLDLCVAEGAKHLAATIDLARGDDGGVVSVTVRDEVTTKRVTRDLDLRAVPEDARALAIAQTADELLRASWAELFIEGSPKKPADAPPEIARAAHPVAPRTELRPARIELGAGFAGEALGSGYAHLGPDFRVSFYPHPRIGPTARLGLRSATTTESTLGSLDASAFLGSAGVRVVAIPQAGRVGLDGTGELAFARIAFDAEARSGSRGVVARDGHGLALYAALGARLWLVLTAPIRASLAVAVGAPLQTVRAVGADASLREVGGALFGAEIAVSAAW